MQLFIAGKITLCNHNRAERGVFILNLNSNDGFHYVKRPFHRCRQFDPGYLYEQPRHGELQNGVPVPTASVGDEQTLPELIERLPGNHLQVVKQVEKHLHKAKPPHATRETVLYTPPGTITSIRDRHEIPCHIVELPA